MKSALSTIILFCCIATTTYAQLLGTDATGKSPLVYPGAAASADLQRSNFSASYTSIANSLYYKHSGLLGMSISGGDRAGMGNLLQNGFTAQYASAALTAGYCFDSEYEAKFKNPEEYERQLIEEEMRLTKRINDFKTDTFFLNNDLLRHISPQYTQYLDTFRVIYFNVGPDANIITYQWLNIAKAITDTMQSKEFYTQISTATIDLRNENNIYARFQDLKDKLAAIEKQLAGKDKPLKPFARDIIYLTIGGSSLNINKITMEPKGYVSSFGKESYTAGYVAFGGTHCIGGELFIGYNLNFTVYDNFERLSPTNYTIDSAINGANGAGKIGQNYHGYTGELVRKESLGLAFQLSFLEPIGKGGQAVITPLYFNIAARGSAGASVQLVTKSGFSMGLNFQYDHIDASSLTKVQTTQYNNYSVGLRLGCLLGNFNKLN